MTINEAFNFFKSLLAESRNKSEQKVYREFIRMLSGLKDRDLSAAEMEDIELELDSLQLNSNPANPKKFYKKAIRVFKKFLNEKHSLISEGHYTTVSTGLGMMFGTTFGVVFLANEGQASGMSLGITLGMIIGLLVGQHLDKQAKAEGRVI